MSTSLRGADTFSAVLNEEEDDEEYVEEEEEYDVSPAPSRASLPASGTRSSSRGLCSCIYIPSTPARRDATQRSVATLRRGRVERRMAPAKRCCAPLDSR